MRIVGEIAHPIMKITVFSYQEKTSIKFEHAQVEHIIKFRQGSGIDTLTDAERLVTPTLLDHVYESLNATAIMRGRAISEIAEMDKKLNFPTII